MFRRHGAHRDAIQAVDDALCGAILGVWGLAGSYAAVGLALLALDLDNPAWLAFWVDAIGATLAIGGLPSGVLQHLFLRDQRPALRAYAARHPDSVWDVLGYVGNIGKVVGVFGLVVLLASVPLSFVGDQTRTEIFEVSWGKALGGATAILLATHFVFAFILPRRRDYAAVERGELVMEIEPMQWRLAGLLVLAAVAAAAVLVVSLRLLPGPP